MSHDTFTGTPKKIATTRTFDKSYTIGLNLNYRILGGKKETSKHLQILKLKFIHQDDHSGIESSILSLLETPVKCITSGI